MVILQGTLNVENLRKTAIQIAKEIKIGGVKKMSQFDFESEIEILEEILSDLERAKLNSLESPYHKHLAESIDVDIEEINARLEELYQVQNEHWAEETMYLNREYERMVL